MRAKDVFLRVEKPAVLMAIGCTLLGSADVGAQTNVQRTPDRALRLVNKDVGDERWVITLDVETGVVTGNVHRADGGDPQFVWCWPQDAASDPMRLRCQGTQGCDEWVDLGEVQIDASFFGPRSCDSTAVPQGTTSHGPGSTAGVSARSSGLRHTPDTRYSLINKEVGGLDWTISYDHLDRTITGNVFDPGGGPPQFVSCRSKINATGFTCVGASGCACGACRPSDWTPLPDVDLPSGFLRTRRCPGAPEPRGLVATLRPSVPADVGFRSLAVSGDVAVAGVPGTAVYFFEKKEGGWKETARIEPFEPYSGRPGSSRFAQQVDVSGDQAVVMDNGAVRVLERRGQSWVLATTITPPESEARLGSVALDGNTIVLTADLGGSYESNRADIYELGAAGWRLSATLPAPGVEPFERVGRIAMDGDRVVLLVTGGTSPHPGSTTRAALEAFATDFAAASLTDPLRTALSPDGQHYYVASLDDASLAVFSIGASPSAGPTRDCRYWGQSLVLRNAGPEGFLTSIKWKAVGTIGLPIEGSDNDPQCNGDPAGTVKATLRFASGGTGEDTGDIPLPCENWATFGKEASLTRGYRYDDKLKTSGPCKKVLLKGRKIIAATCDNKGPSPLSYTLTEGVSEEEIDAVLQVGELRYCTQYDGHNGADGSDGKKFQGKKDLKPPTCPVF